MGRVSTCMATDFLEPDRCNRARQPIQFGQPVGEPQIAHTTAIVAAGFERRRAAGDQAVKVTDGPAGRGAQIERQNAARGLLGWVMQTSSSVCRARREGWPVKAAVSPGPEGWSGQVRRRAIGSPGELF